MKTKNCDECESEYENQPQSTSLKDGMWNALLQHRKILINGEINEDLIEKAVMQVILMNEGDDELEFTLNSYERSPIYIYINSYGGTLDEALALISVMENSRSPIYTIILGKAYSAAFLIAIAGHYRTASKYAYSMHHQGSTGIVSDVSKILDYTEHIKKIQTVIDVYVSERTKIPKTKLKEIFEHSLDFYMSANDMLKLGVIDDIIGVTDFEDKKDDENIEGDE